MNELKSCYFCGSKVEIHGGIEDWTPTFYDPDSGGEPYTVVCRHCNLRYDTSTYDYEEAVNRWNNITVNLMGMV